jgi:hypothetical protein
MKGDKGGGEVISGLGEAGVNAYLNCIMFQSEEVDPNRACSAWSNGSPPTFSSGRRTPYFSVSATLH